jgi:hypothetical protein
MLVNTAQGGNKSGKFAPEFYYVHILQFQLRFHSKQGPEQLLEQMCKVV